MQVDGIKVKTKEIIIKNKEEKNETENESKLKRK